MNLQDISKEIKQAIESPYVRVYAVIDKTNETIRIPSLRYLERVMERHNLKDFRIVDPEKTIREMV